MLNHKDIEFPEVDLSGDEGSPEYEGEEFVAIPDTNHARWIRPPQVSENYWKVVQDDWREIVTEYETSPDDFVTSWHYLNDHPIYWTFDQTYDNPEWPPNHMHRLRHLEGIAQCVDLMVAHVHPDTLLVDKDPAKNIATRVWYETGHRDLLPAEYEYGHIGQHQWHDWKLDGGAATVEAAIIELARKIWEKYGNDRRVADAEADQDRVHFRGSDARDTGNETSDG